MIEPFTERTGRRVVLSALTLPAPARFPYAEHRSMHEVIADEQAVARAVGNYVCEAGETSQKQAISVAETGELVYEKGRAETLRQQRPALTITPDTEVQAMTPHNAPKGFSQDSFSAPPRKLDAVLAAMRADDWPEAIRLAAKFPRLGPQAQAIMRAHEAIQRPDFQRQLGRSPAQLIAAGKAALIERFGNAGN